jgi:hypothetical protein
LRISKKQKNCSGFSNLHKIFTPLGKQNLRARTRGTLLFYKIQLHFEYPQSWHVVPLQPPVQ